MSIHTIPVVQIQPGDTIITPDNHQWSVKYIDGPDKCGSMDVALVDELGNQKMDIIADSVKIVM